MMHCVFCHIEPGDYLLENASFFAIRDIHPVSKGHSLIIAKRHIENFFQLLPEELADLHNISGELKELLEREYNPNGYNLAMNCGAAAGQSVFHFHMHFIPRYSNDRKRMQGLREYLKELL